MFHQPAADDDDFRVEDVDDIGNGNAGVFGRLFDDMLDEFIATFDRFAQIAAAQILQGRPKHFGQNRFLAILHGLFDSPEDGGAAGQRFEAAFVAAAAFGSADFEHHVTDLARGAIETGIQLAFQNQPSADARAEKNADHIAGFGFELDLVNPERAGVAIVFQKDLHLELLFQFLLERHIVPIEVGRENNLAGFGVHRPGRPDADGLDLFEVEVAFIHRLTNATGDAVDDFVRAAIRFGAHARASDAVEFVVEDAREDFGAAKIDADDATVLVSFCGHDEPCWQGRIQSSVQDRGRKEESRCHGVSSPSPRDEGVGRGTGIGEVDVNTGRRGPRLLQRSPSPWPAPRCAGRAHSGRRVVCCTVSSVNSGHS